MKQFVQNICLIVIFLIVCACSDNEENILSAEEKIEITPQFSVSSRSVALTEGLVVMQLSEVNHYKVLQQNTYDLSKNPIEQVDAATATSYGDNEKKIFVSYPDNYFFRLYGNLNAKIPAAFVGDKTIDMTGIVAFNMRPVSCAVEVNVEDMEDNLYLNNIEIDLSGFKQVKLDVMSVKDKLIKTYEEIESDLIDLPLQEKFSSTTGSILASNIKPCIITSGESLMTISANGHTYEVKAPQNYTLRQGKKYVFTIRLGVAKAEIKTCTIADFDMVEAAEITNTLHIRYNMTEDVYEIFTAQGLKTFADIVNKGTSYAINSILATPQNAAANGKLMHNVDMYYYNNWKPIGSAASPYIGKFDGNNKIVSYLCFSDAESINLGLFGYTFKNEISRVIMQKSHIQGKENVGILVGNAEETAFNSCIIKSSQAIVSSKTVGVLAGYTNNSTFDNCTTSGDTVSTIDLTANNIGGFVGYSKNSIYTECNTIDVIVAATSGNENKGGFVGYSNGSKFYYTIARSQVSYESKGRNLGGFVGKSNESTYACCVGEGGKGVGIANIHTGSNDESVNIGGFVGYSISDKLEASYASCVCGDDTANPKYENVGGFAGYIENTTIKACRSSAIVRAKTNAGGIVGYMKSGTVASCSYTNEKDSNPIYVASAGKRGAVVGYQENGEITCSGASQAILIVGNVVGGTCTDCVTAVENYDSEILPTLQKYSGTVSDGTDTFTMTQAWLAWNRLWWQ